ncbi:hypothetical protein Cgig2_029192 [Carnegiea gigantea]|uniref:DUF7731 domain-containing protein n=1 Tax=Carnegiea gigantea TaxID=171969 RepID=A0A9Q1KKF5_9CARY|nr:hypothetical protein Cgig2_029192 [Carnegiea gigantea]
MGFTAEDCDYEPHVGALGKHPEKGGSGDKDQGSDKGDKDPSPADGVDKDQGSEKGDKDPSPADGGDKDSGPSDKGNKDPKASPSGEDSGSDEGDKDPEGGAIENDPAHIVANALLCFNAKESLSLCFTRVVLWHTYNVSSVSLLMMRQIYCSCEESYRLSESGEFHVPHDRVEQFCNGPCLQETKLVLNCVEGIMGHFTFFNKATTQDVRDTVLAACGNGETGGDLNVTRHVKEKEGKDEEGKDESIACKGTIPLVFSILATFIAQLFFLY